MTGRELNKRLDEIAAQVDRLSAYTPEGKREEDKCMTPAWRTLCCRASRSASTTKVKKTASTEQRALADVSLRSEQPGLREDVSRAMARILGHETIRD